MRQDGSRRVQLTGRSGLGLAFLLILFISPLNWASRLKQQGPVAGPLQQPIAFTPHVTPLILTVTPQVTAPIPLGPQASPRPLPEPPEVVGTPVPTLPISSGDSKVGYDFIEGSDTPTWRIWYEGEVLIIEPTDPLATALLDAFRDEANKRASAIAAIEQAEQDIKNADTATTWGFLSFVGGIAAAIPTCAATPFTGIAALGCGGGIAAAIAGAGAMGVSGNQRSQATAVLETEQANLARAEREVRELFDALRASSGSQ